MNRTLAMTMVLVCLVAPDGIRAQSPPATPATMVPARVQVDLSRFEGTKKTVSMPNTLWVLISPDAKDAYRAEMTAGLQVPIAVFVNNTTTVAYKDAGNRIQCSVSVLDAGRYLVKLYVQQASVDPGTKTGPPPANPILRSFSQNFDVVLRDGQSAKVASATDPVTGETITVDVSLALVK